MIALLGGAGAAVGWALATLCSSRSTQMLDPLTVVAWVMLLGFTITAPLALAMGIPSHVSGGSWVWLVAAGAGNVAGLALAQAALRIGQVALVAPLASTEGAIAAVIAILAGESVTAPVGAALVVIAVGVYLSAVPRTAAREPVSALHHATRASDIEAATLAIFAARAVGPADRTGKPRSWL